MSSSSAIRFSQCYEDEGTVAVKPRSPQMRRLDLYGEDILGWIEATPDMTLQELSVRLHEVHQVRAPISTIDDWLRWRKISFKKTAHASEQERADVQTARVLWRKRQAWLVAHPAKIGAIVFIDETEINTKMARLGGALSKRLPDARQHPPWPLKNHVHYCRVAL